MLKRVTRVKGKKKTTKKKSAIGSKPSKKKAKKTASAAASGFAQARRENEERARRRETGMLPFRLRLKVGEEAKVILLDDAGDNRPYFMYEHHWQGPTGKWDQFDSCIKDSEVCPLCNKLGKEGYYVMMLTCIDLRSFTSKGVDYKFSRKLLPVKATMIPKFERLWKKKGTFRGMGITLWRDNERGTNIGDSVEFAKWFSEKDLRKYKMKNNQGKLIDLSQPIDYEKSFPYPKKEELAARHGAGQMAGSEDFSDAEELEDSDWG